MIHTLVIKEKEELILYGDGQGNTWQVTFAEILNTPQWKDHKVIAITHPTKTVEGASPVTFLNRVAYTANMITGDEVYHRHRGAWDYNVAIHTLYAILDGKTGALAQQEIDNISKHRTSMDKATLDWNNERVERIYAIEQEMLKEHTEDDLKALKDSIEEIKAEEPPFHTHKQIQKMYIIAADDKEPDIGLHNVSPDHIADYEKKHGKILLA